MKLLFYSTCLPQTVESYTVYYKMVELPEPLPVEEQAMIFFCTDKRFHIANDLTHCTPSRGALFNWLADRYDIPMPDSADGWTELDIDEGEDSYDLEQQMVSEDYEDIDTELGIPTDYDVLVKTPYMGEEGSDTIERHDIDEWKQKTLQDPQAVPQAIREHIILY